MTYLEKWKQEHGDIPNDEYPIECPSDLEVSQCYAFASCKDCWDQEMPEDEDKRKPDEPTIKDSGDRTEFNTGAVRDMREGKGRCDLMPLDVARDLLHDEVLAYISGYQQNGNIMELYCALESFAEFAYDSICEMLLEVAKHFEEGAKKYGENNWQKGIPTWCYIDSAVRHYLKFMRGDKDEPHDRAFVWNLMCCIWTCKHEPEMKE